MKRKLIAIVVMLAIFTVSVSASNTFELTQVHYPIYANGNLVAPDELPTLSYQNRTYVPLRKLSEASGLSVYFDEIQQSISIYNTPLINAQACTLVANAYKQAIDVADCFDGYDDALISFEENVFESGPYVAYYLELLPKYIYTYIPMEIEQLLEEVQYVDEIYKAAGDSIGAIPVEDLYARVYYAQEALKNAELAYQALAGYVNGIYTHSYFKSLYYGNNQDGYINLMFEQYAYVKQDASWKFDNYIDLALGIQ